MKALVYRLINLIKPMILWGCFFIIVYLGTTNLSWLETHQYLANWLIGGLGLLITIRVYLAKRGHSLSVVYSRSDTLHLEPGFDTVYITNNKDKAEIITEINVLYGGNVWLQLKSYKYDKELLTIPPYETKVVKLDPVSVYTRNLYIVDMGKEIMNPVINPKFIFTTPNGKVKAKRTKELLFNSYVDKALTKWGFWWVVPHRYDINGTTYSYKIKYCGKIMTTKDVYVSFFIYTDGTMCDDFHPVGFLKENEMNSIETAREAIAKMDWVKTAEIYERHRSLDNLRLGSDGKPIKPLVLPWWKYMIVRSIVQIMYIHNNKKGKMKTKEN